MEQGEPKSEPTPSAIYWLEERVTTLERYTTRRLTLLSMVIAFLLGALVKTTSTSFGLEVAVFNHDPSAWLIWIGLGGIAAFSTWLFWLGDYDRFFSKENKRFPSK
jgi:purine-cytosine permease-like protein